jgi:importin subunit alpha-1
MNMQDPANMSILNNVTWAISNLCQGKPAPDMALVAPAIEPLTALLHKEVSVDVLVDAVWALSYLSDGPNDRIERVMQTGVTAKLVELLKDKTSLLLIRLSDASEIL